MKSWRLGGGSGTWADRVYEALRRGVNRRLVEYLKRNALSRHGGKVLEAGSGTAGASSLLASAPDVFGVALDADIDALKEARRRDPALPVVAGDVYRLPFKEGVFDLVWNSSTVEHLEDPGPALAEMARVVARNGHVFVGVPYRRGPLGFQSLISKTAVGVWLGPAFSRAELLDGMRRACLEPVGTVYYFFHVFIGVLSRKS